MATKFSQFTAGATTANTLIVGFDSNLNTNNKYTLSQLGTGLSSHIPTIYSSNGTVGGDRKVLITNTLQFRNSGDTLDVFKLHTDGKVSLGKSASSTGLNSIAIGSSASASSTETIAIGTSSICSSPNSVSIGGYSSATANLISAVGYNVDVSGADSIGLGHFIDSTGTQSITINGASGTVSTSTQYACGIYMTSNTTPDFEVVGGGESTLNTNLKVNGQSHSVLKTGITNLTFNWNDSNIQSSTLAASTPTFTASNPKAGATYILTLTQTGAVTPTWTGVKWPGDVAPVLSGANKTDVITLICYDEAANSGAGAYYGSFTLNFTT